MDRKEEVASPSELVLQASIKITQANWIRSPGTPMARLLRLYLAIIVRVRAGSNGRHFGPETSLFSTMDHNAQFHSNKLSPEVDEERFSSRPFALD